MSKQEEAQTGPELVPQGGIGAATEAGASAADEELAGAVTVLDEGAPLVLFDGLVVTDGGHGIQSQYVDMGVEKQTRSVRCRAIDGMRWSENRQSLTRSSTAW